MPRSVSHLAVIAALSALSCTTAAPPPAATPPAAAVVASADDTLPLSAALAAGKKTVESVCLTCHTTNPPHRTAPPFTMIAMRYRMAAADSADAIERIVSWVREPAIEKSLLPAHVIERFGLMPPLPLPEQELRNAAAYVLTLGRGHGMGGMRGRMGGVR